MPPRAATPRIIAATGPTAPPPGPIFSPLSVCAELATRLAFFARLHLRRVEKRGGVSGCAASPHENGVRAFGSLLIEFYREMPLETVNLKRWLPSRRTWAVAAIHCAAFAVAYWLAFALRLSLPIPAYWQTLLWQTLPAVVAIKLVVFIPMGHRRYRSRHPTLSDLSALLRAATLSSLVLATLDLMISSYHVPRWVLALDWAMTVLTIGGLRSIWRLSREELRAWLAPKRARKAIIVGANPSGENLARQLLDGQRYGYIAVGFLDDDPRLHGARLVGVRVLGTIDQVANHARGAGARDILVVSGVLTGQRLRDFMECCKREGLNLKIIPAMDDLLSDRYHVRIRDVDINDLLRREPVVLSSREIEQRVAGKCVLVTGAGGSIGAEICRQVLKFQPRRLLLVERAENNLFQIDREFQALPLETEIVPLLADVTDAARMRAIFAEFRPEVVFHAAAHKHVPMMEHNPGEAIKNNVLGTARLAELAAEHEVGHFVLISTDKSVNPTSIMGVSKQLAERFVHACSEQHGTKFLVVRFGNVLGSAGSVVPIFQEQIRAGGPITVTHPDMERFFMTIPEASQLVLQAAAMGRGGEIFVLDMGSPVKIVELARDLMRLSHVKPGEIEIVYTGLRPGEKLHEELYFNDEQRLPTPHPKLFVAYHRPFGLAEARQTVRELAQLVDGPSQALRARLAKLAPEYRPPAEPRLPAHSTPESGSPVPASPVPASPVPASPAVSPSESREATPALKQLHGAAELSTEDSCSARAD